MKKNTKFFIKFTYSIVLFLAISGISIVKTDNVVPSFLFGIEHLDKVVHILMYFALTSTILSEGYFSKSITLRKSYLLLLIYVILYGAILEVIQGTSGAGRSFDFMDITANSFGTISAYILFTLFKKDIINIKPINYLLQIKKI